MKIINNTKQGYLIAEEGDGINICGRMKYQRGNVQKQICGTIDHQGGNNKGVVIKVVMNKEEYEGQSGLIQPLDRKYKEHGQKRQEHIEFKKDNCSHALRASVIPLTMNELRIRKLTPKECWRLMDFSDQAFEKASQVNSNTQLYKQAGNSIVVNILYEILKELLRSE